MVRGCLAWQHDGLTPIPESVRAATDDYAESSDMLQAFLSEAIELVPDAEVRAAELFDHYSQWADARRLQPRERLTQTAFGRKMSARFTKVKTSANPARYQGLARRNWSA